MFPRPEARKSMERYAEKMRQRKLKGGKKKIAGEVLREEEMDQAAEKWIVKVNAASSAIAQRWLRKAQDSLTAKFKGKGDQLRTDVERTVNAMPAEDDWFFGAALREECLADCGVRGRCTCTTASSKALGPQRAIYTVRIF